MARATKHLNTNALWADVGVRTLCRLGLTHVVISPGSRSTPLAHAFAESDATHRKGFGNAESVTTDHGTGVYLNALFGAFFNFDVHVDGIADIEHGNFLGALFFAYVCDYRIHNCSLSSKFQK